MKQSYIILLVMFMMIGANTTLARDTTTLAIFAAASLTDVFEDIGEAYEATYPDVKLLFNFAGSSTLATQLSQGAPADVFASANITQMDRAIEENRIGSSPQTFAKNRLTVIIPADNPGDIHTLHDLANPDVRLILAAPLVPVRAYTDMVLEHMANNITFGTDFRSALEANIVSEEPNVRQVAAKIALGEADAGFVYLTDITPDIAEDVLTLAIPDTFNPTATYPIAITDDTRQPELAQAFIDFILSNIGQDILVRWNFVSVRIPHLPDLVQIPTNNDLTVDGQVYNPLTLSAHSLREDFSPTTFTLTGNNGSGTVTGALLWDIIQAAQPNLNADVINDQLSMFIVVTATTGEQVVIAWAEIDPSYSDQPILLAYARNEDDFFDELQLIVSADAGDGRSLVDVVNISLRDAPKPADY